MSAISVTKARENIYQLLADVNYNSEPVTITNSRGKNGVLIGEDDWNAIQETLYLNSMPGLAESIIVGGNTPFEECLSESEVEW
ncbi:MAG: type II toxin-antitoxin system Phd/YefM family antitoxin [Blautia sp.]|nr:type II toxin-antitoxin system Phd/YefM family antitoxin [Blautia sp.]